MKKWTLSMIVLVMTAMVAAACGGNNSAKEGGTSGASGAPTHASSEAPKSDVILTLSHWKVAYDPGFKAVAEAFEQKTGIKVKTEVTTPDDSYRQKMTAAATANDMPDIYAYWSNNPAGGAFDGIALEWSEILNEDSQWRDSFIPSALAGATVTQELKDKWVAKDKYSNFLKNDTKVGDIYDIPINVGSNYVIYANKKILEDAGVSTDAPASMEDWLDRMRAVKAKGNAAGFVFTAKTFTVYENWMINFVDYMKNGPESFAALMQGEEKMSDPKHMHIAEFLETIAKEGLIIPGAVTLDIDPADQAFAQGQAAYLLGGTFTHASLLAMGMKADEFAGFRVPAYADSVDPDAKVAPNALVGLSVNSRGEHVEEAVEFVKFMTSEEGMILYANAAFDLPAVKISDVGRLEDTIASMYSSLSMEDTWFSQNPAIVAKIGGPEWQQFHESKQKILLNAMTAAEAAAQFDKDAEAEKAKK